MADDRMADHRRAPHDAEEWARLERATAPLARLVSDAVERSLDPDGAEAARFHDWMARDLRARERPTGRADDAVLARVRERALALAHAARLRVRSGGGVPVVREGAPGGAERGRAAPWLDLAVAAGVGREIWDEPCERWVELPDLVPRGDYLALSVSGESMLPLFHPGDVVLVRRGGAVERGTVVVARHPDDGYVVKEVARVGRREIELRSLNPAWAPVRIPRAAALVVGTVLLRWCPHESAGRGAGAPRRS
jgi:SOS-response transcriptional repressor LexA